MPFAFSLAAVLAFRQQREAAEERALTALLHQLAAAHETFGRIEVELRNIRSMHAQSSPERLQAVALHERYARLAVLEQGRAEMLQHIAALTTQRDAQQQLYLAARRDRELLDELEAKQRAGFATEALRREAKRMDDLFLARRLRP